MLTVSTPTSWRESASPVDNAVADSDVFRSLLEDSGLCLARLDLRLRVVDVNDDFVAQFGQPRDRLHGRSFIDLLHPSTHLPMNQQFERLLEGRRNRFVQHLTGFGPREAVFTGDVTGIAVRGAAGELALILVVVRLEKTEERSSVVECNPILTELDAKILEGVATGESSVRLASRLFLSRQGVEYHVASMIKRFRVPNRAALVSRAYSVGVLGVASWPPKVSPGYVK